MLILKPLSGIRRAARKRRKCAAGLPVHRVRKIEIYRDAEPGLRGTPNHLCASAVRGWEMTPRMSAGFAPDAATTLSGFLQNYIRLQCHDS